METLRLVFYKMQALLCYFYLRRMALSCMFHFTVTFYHTPLFIPGVPKKTLHNFKPV